MVLFLALSPPATLAHSRPRVRFTKAILVQVVCGDIFPDMLCSVTVHRTLNVILLVNIEADVKEVIDVGEKIFGAVGRRG